MTSQPVMELIAQDFHLIRDAIEASENHIAIGFLKHRIKTTAAKKFTEMATEALNENQTAILVRLYWLISFQVGSKSVQAFVPLACR